MLFRSVGNSSDNIAFINRLVTQDLIELSPRYRLLEADPPIVLPSGLSLDPVTGRLAGTVASNAKVGDYPIIIQRYNKDGESVAQAFTLRVFANSYSQWIGSFTLGDAGVGGDSDGDGVRNLVEYALDRNPALAETGNPFSLGVEEGKITLTYRRSTMPPDVTLIPEWSTGLDASAIWRTDGITVETLQTDTTSELLKAFLTIDPGDPKRFLRLRATLVTP